MKTNQSNVPVDVSNEPIPAEYSPVIEEMCRRNHKGWLARQKADGWRLGKEYNVAFKRDPDMLPYKDLSSERKEMYKEHATSLLRYFLVLDCCKIVPKIRLAKSK